MLGRCIKPVRAVITEDHSLNGLNNRILFFDSPGDWKPKVKVLVRLVSAEASLPGFQTRRLLSVCSQGLSFVLSYTERGRSLVSLPLLKRIPVLSNQGPTLMTSFNLYLFLRVSTSNEATLEVRASSESGKDMIQSINCTSSSFSQYYARTRSFS